MDFGDFDDDFFEAKSTSKKVQSIQDSNWAPHQSESGVSVNLTYILLEFECLSLLSCISYRDSGFILFLKLELEKLT